MRIPIDELRNRVANLQEILRLEHVGGALLSQRADTLYYSGTAQNVHVYIPREGRPVVLAYKDFARAQEESAWGVIPLAGLSKLPELIIGAGLPIPASMGLELDVLPVNQYERYEGIFPKTRLVDVSKPIRKQRAVKTGWEIERLRESATIFPQVWAYAQEVVSPGMREIELEALLAGKARTLGHGGYVRMHAFGSEFYVGTVTAGARAAIPSFFDGPVNGPGTSIAHPQGAGNAPIQAGEPILVDMVTVVNGYQIDQTRIMALEYLDPLLVNAYNTALELEELIRTKLVPGRITGEVYSEVVDWVAKNTPYELNFMGYGQQRVSFVGHGVGLELDELPVIARDSKDVLIPGMVVAIEPKFVFPGLGVVGIEDTVLIERPSGAEYLSETGRDLIIV